ncbi:MAG: hypothetical protein JO030_03790, partial [Candidatus Eremiobacteraeota bacterium]|nr:hypothetical protein [Candidatus Eremiobacteraeota bacterium]
ALLDVPLDIAAAALILSAGFVLLAAGQVVPFALAALAGCGAALRRRSDAIAGVLSAVTLVEPHLGLPVWLAMLFWRPRSRAAALATAAALALAGVALVGAQTFVEYVASVLPAQASAEHAYVYQYGLTYGLASLGAPASAALLAGEVSYAVLCAIGVLRSAPVAAALNRPEMLAFVPAACSVIAGPYVHMVDLALAVPAALVLATALDGRARTAAALALLLLAVPWIPAWITKKLFLATVLIVIVLLWRLRVDGRIAAACGAAVAAGLYLLELSPPSPLVSTTPGSFSVADLAQSAWSAYVAQLQPGTALWLVVKFPTWIALATLLCLFFYRQSVRSSPAAA